MNSTGLTKGGIKVSIPSLVPAHGGPLINRVLSPLEIREWEKKLPELKKIHLNSREMSDLDMIACGALSPLEGFMTKEDYDSVVETLRLKNKTPWSLPITLSVTEEEAGHLNPGDDIVLCDNSEQPVAILHLEDKFKYDKKREAENVYRTTDEAHPGVAVVYQQGAYYLGGRVSILKRIQYTDFLEFRLDPLQTRQEFEKQGWKTVVGFQTRNPIHRAHEYLLKCALEIVDGVLIHPLVGATKEGDIPADIRMKSYQALISAYFPPHRTMLTVMPAAMRYAGPREAIFHAIVRQNYGCTHFIVGRDHAGVGNYYGSYDAQKIFETYEPGELKITTLNFEHAAFCKSCLGMVSSKTCPHDSSHHVFLSGTKVREMLSSGKYPPPEFSRKEVVDVLIKGLWYPSI